LLGYVTQYSGGPNPAPGDMIPANQLVGALYPKRVDSVDTFRPAYDRQQAGSQYTQFTTAVWPNKVDGSGTANPGSYQKYGPTDIPAVQRCFDFGTSATPEFQDVNNYYYAISGYDVAAVQNENATTMRNEIHYALFWTGYTVPTDPCHPTSSETGNASDDPHQLGYSDPPETTVVTWDTYFRDIVGGVVQHTKKDIVLFIGGQAKPYDSAFMASESWKATP
jgi:hypothetical protein